MKEKVKYFANLIEPYKDKYGSIIPTTKRFNVESKPNKNIKKFYSTFGKDAKHKNFQIIKANYPNSFSQLDYILKHKEIIIQYGHGSAEFESVPCRLFKEIIKTEEEIVEL